MRVSVGVASLTLHYAGSCTALRENGEGGEAGERGRGGWGKREGEEELRRDGGKGKETRNEEE